MRLLGVIAGLILTASVSAQIDIERLRQDGSDGWSGALSADLTLRSGNVELVEFGPAMSVAYGRQTDQFILIGSGDVGWEGGERFSNEALAHVRYVRKVSDALQLEGFAQTNFDKSRQLDARGVGGAGIRIRLTGTVSRSLRFGTSLMMEHERNAAVVGMRHRARTSVLRWSNYVAIGYQLSDAASLSATSYYQPDIAAFGDVRVLVDGRLSVTITESVGLTTGISVHHDSDPVDGVADTDFQLSSGIEVAW